VSRSVLAERFRHYLNEPLMANLQRWRLQLGAQMLASTSYSVARIASEVGYESEAAFNRAFSASSKFLSRVSAVNQDRLMRLGLQ